MHIEEFGLSVELQERVSFLKLGELIGYTDVIAYGGNLDSEIGDVTGDSRQAKPQTIFVAVTGFKTDGHKYIADALHRGASAVIIENDAFCSDEYTWIQVSDSRKALADLSSILYGEPSRKMNIVGVTGTNGKTTITNLITAILEDAGYLVGLLGTIHNRIGQEILPVEHTTPEASELQKLFKRFWAQGADYTVMEVSSHALELNRVRNTEFDVAVFTNLTQEHLDFHGDMENYLAAKGKLFSTLGQNADKKRRKFAIFNADDPYSYKLMEMTRVPIITYGIKKDADVQAEKICVSHAGVKFILKYADRQLPVKLKLTGLFNVYNSLAAIAVGLVEGIPAEKIIASLGKITGIPGRFENVNSGSDYAVIVDYSHTPDSLENCLKTARELARGRIITVFGCGGDRDRTKRPLMGEVAGRLSDLCIVTSDNPRSELPGKIIEEVLPGLAKGAGTKPFLQIEDRQKAIFRAIKEAHAEDVVIIAGKGHENYQLIGSEVIPFDDKEVAREALQQTGKWDK